jgi:polyisoprenoid-binding protein YceI
MNSYKLLPLLALTAVSITALSAEKTYKVGAGRESMQIATVESVTDFETFTGTTHKVTGSVKFDKAQRSLSGKITIDVASIKTGIDLRNEHMRSDMWMNAEKFKSITFEVTKSKHVKGNEYDVTGKFTMDGVTKTITVRTTINDQDASDASKAAGFEGDVLQLKTKFKVKLSDYGVMIPKMAATRVSDEVTIAVTTYAQTG